MVGRRIVFLALSGALFGTDRLDRALTIATMAAYDRHEGGLLSCSGVEERVRKLNHAPVGADGRAACRSNTSALVRRGLNVAWVIRE